MQHPLMHLQANASGIEGNCYSLKQHSNAQIEAQTGNSTCKKLAVQQLIKA